MNIHKSLLPSIVTAFVCFLVGIIAGLYHGQGSFIYALISGIWVAACGAFIAVFLTSTLICGMKGRWVFLILGVLSIFLFPLTIFGAIRIAKPNSYWARKYYTPEMMKLALERFPATKQVN